MKRYVIQQKKRISQKIFWVTLILLILNGGSAYCFADAPMLKKKSQMYFERDIQPILRKHCYKCHNSEIQMGNLRLDQRKAIQQGGKSGPLLLTSDLERNLLYQKITHSDPQQRMPLSNLALTADEIKKIETWLKNGAQWMVSLTNKSGSQLDQVRHPQQNQKWYTKIRSQLIEIKSKLPYANEWLYSIALMMFFVLISERIRKYVKKQSSPEQVSSLTRRLSQIQPVSFFVMMLLISLGFSTAIIFELIHKEDPDYSTTISKSGSFQPRWEKLFGKPPIPSKPERGNQIHRVYYRGNTERSSKLFNYGNYCTAIFELDICDQNHQVVTYDTTLPEGPFYLKIQIKRAPYSCAPLFSKQIRSIAFLSQQNLPYLGSTKITKPIVNFSAVEEGEHWEAYFPLGTKAKLSKEGLIYLYFGSVREDEAGGAPHYGIHYQLQTKEGKFSPETDLWMNCIYIPQDVQAPDPNKIPTHEWFDDQPLPMIQKSNTKDQRLLGVEDYLAPVPQESSLVDPQAE